MEVAVVECGEDSHFEMELPSGCQAMVFCVPRGKLSAPQGLQLIKNFDLGAAPKDRGYVFFLGDFEMGYILGRLASYRVTLYTQRNDLDTFQTIKVKIAALPKRTQEPIDCGPPPRTVWQSDLTSQFLLQLEEKYKAGFLLNPLTRATKKTSVLAQMRNIADGICASYRARYPNFSEAVPGAEEISEMLYEDLKRRGVLSERMGQVGYFVPGAPVAQKASVPLANAKKLTLTLKLDTLHKYLEKFLLQPAVRAVKEKSARAQLTNLAKGAVTAAKTKYGANISIPTEDVMSADIFNNLVECGAISVDGLNVSYCDDKIEEIASDSTAQEAICEEREPLEHRRVQSDLRVTILREALAKYHQKFLTNPLLAAKASKGVKEQIKNIVQGSVASAAKSNPEVLRTLPSVDDLTETIYRVMVSRKVVVTVGSAIRYQQDAIQRLEGELQDSDLWEEAASPETDQVLAQQIVPKVLQQCFEHKRMLLRDVYELAKRSTHTSVVFSSAGKSPASILTIAKEVVHIILSGEDVRLQSGANSLEEVEENLDRFGSLEVLVRGGGSEGEEDAA